jgi:hypothetical protein
LTDAVTTSITVASSISYTKQYIYSTNTNRYLKLFVTCSYNRHQLNNLHQFLHLHTLLFNCHANKNIFSVRNTFVHTQFWLLNISIWQGYFHRFDMSNGRIFYRQFFLYNLIIVWFIHVVFFFVVWVLLRWKNHLFYLSINIVTNVVLQCDKILTFSIRWPKKLFSKCTQYDPFQIQSMTFSKDYMLSICRTNPLMPCKVYILFSCLNNMM